jgi:hypothetical protein
MKFVIFLKDYQGPRSYFAAGSLARLPEAIADALIRDGFAIERGGEEPVLETKGV